MSPDNAAPKTLSPVDEAAFGGAGKSTPTVSAGPVVTDAAPGTPLVERPEFVVINMGIFNYDLEKGRGVSLQQAWNLAKAKPLPVPLKDDEGNQLVGATMPATAKLDGPVITCDVNFRLEPRHKVQKLFGVKDADLEALAVMDKERARFKAALEQVGAETIGAIATCFAQGGSAASALELAKSQGVSDDTAQALVDAVARIYAEQPDAVKQAVSNEPPRRTPVNHSIAGEAGGSELTGDAKVAARIGGSVEASGAPSAG